MVTAALLSLSSLDKTSHALKDLIGSPQKLVDEVFAVKLEEPVIPLVLL